MSPDFGLKAKLKPEIDTGEAEKEVSDLEQMMSELEDLNIDMDVDESGLGDINDALSGAGLDTMGGGGGGGGGGSGGQAGGSGGGAAGGGLIQRLTGGGGLAKVALGGAVGYGILKGIQGLASASPKLAKVIDMFKTTMSLFFRPFGNKVAEPLLKFAKNGLTMAKNFNKIASEKGLGVAVMEIIPDLFEGIGETLLDATGLSDLMNFSELGEQIIGGLALGSIPALATLLSIGSIPSLGGMLGIGGGGALSISSISVTGALSVGGTLAVASVAGLGIGSVVAEALRKAGITGEDSDVEDAGEDTRDAVGPGVADRTLGLLETQTGGMFSGAMEFGLEVMPGVDQSTVKRQSRQLDRAKTRVQKEGGSLANTPIAANAAGRAFNQLPGAGMMGIPGGATNVAGTAFNKLTGSNAGGGIETKRRQLKRAAQTKKAAATKDEGISEEEKEELRNIAEEIQKLQDRPVNVSIDGKNLVEEEKKAQSTWDTTLDSLGL